MDVEKVFHMNGGHGNTSYARNSSLQKKGSDRVKHITTETIQDLCQSLFTTTSGGGDGGGGGGLTTTITVADMGCSCGPNTLSTIRDIYHAVAAASLRRQSAAAVANKGRLHPLTAPASGPHDDDDDDHHHHHHWDRHRSPELFVYLNDLPSNDFNSIFKSLPDLYSELQLQRVSRTTTAAADHRRRNPPSLFVSALPGSFYSRLFPSNSLHFVYSSYSLHWLSKVPPGIYDESGHSLNKNTIYISTQSPPRVIQAYQDQFQTDFTSFLRSRFAELVNHVGRMVIIMLGRDGPNHIDRGNSFLWELLTRSFHILISQGLVKSEMLDSYDVHFYSPSRNEVEEVVKQEGSFSLNRVELFGTESGDGDDDVSHGGEAIAKAVRAIQEPMLSSHFGEGILDELFRVYGRLVDEEAAKEGIKPLTMVLVLTKVRMTT